MGGWRARSDETWGLGHPLPFPHLEKASRLSREKLVHFAAEAGLLQDSADRHADESNLQTSLDAFVDAFLVGGRVVAIDEGAADEEALDHPRVPGVENAERLQEQWRAHRHVEKEEEDHVAAELVAREILRELLLWFAEELQHEEKEEDRRGESREDVPLAQRLRQRLPSLGTRGAAVA